MDNPVQSRALSRERLPSLDGMRAVSFMVVFVSHLGFMHGHPGGFGVSVFFVVSGYLITTLLIREYQKYGSVSLKRFYARRTVRIFPAMYVTLLLSGILSVTHIFTPLPGFWAIVLEVLYFSNYTAWYSRLTKVIYILPATTHFWSLCVEEHFYLLFPVLFCFLLHRNIPYRKIVWILVSICCCFLVWRFIAVSVIPYGEEWCYRTSDSRMESILWGCCLACIEQVPEWKAFLNRRTLERFLIPICLLILAETFIFHEYGRMTSRFTAQAIALMPMIYYGVHFPQSPIIRPLNTRILVHIGTLSYGLYLVHLMTVDLCERYVHGGRLVFWASCALLTWATALAMHWTVERPLERLRARLRRT